MGETPEETGGPPQGHRHVSPGGGANAVFLVVTALNFIALIAVAVWFVLHPPEPPAEMESRPSPRPELAEARVHRAIEVYRISEQQLPASLEVLEARALLQRMDLYYPAGDSMWSYNRGGRDYNLVRADERE